MSRPKHLDRRSLAALLMTAALVPHAAVAQPAGRKWHIGFVFGPSEAAARPELNAILRKLAERGLVEGRDFTATFRWGDGHPGRSQENVAALLALDVDLLVTFGTNAAQAVRDAKTRVPAVFTMVSDPVGSGIVATLARPGGNITGIANMLPDTGGKRLELLRSVRPGLKRVGVVGDPANAGKMIEVEALRRTAGAAGVDAMFLPVRTPADIDALPTALASDGAGALIVMVDAVTRTHRNRLVAQATTTRLPAIYQDRSFVDAGGLMSYGYSTEQFHTRTAIYIERVLKGARPADLPVERPDRFELVVNAKAAKAIGLVFPADVLAGADEVIE